MKPGKNLIPKQAQILSFAPQSLATHVSALSSLPTAGDARVRLALPTDLFMVSVYFPTEACASSADHSDVRIQATLLRKGASRFVSKDAGQLFFGLLSPLGFLKFLRAPLLGLKSPYISVNQFCSNYECLALRDKLLLARDTEQRVG
jgi:hypothetical protein